MCLIEHIMWIPIIHVLALYLQHAAKLFQRVSALLGVPRARCNANTSAINGNIDGGRVAILHHIERVVDLSNKIRFALCLSYFIIKLNGFMITKENTHRRFRFDPPNSLHFLWSHPPERMWRRGRDGPAPPPLMENGVCHKNTTKCLGRL